MIPKAAPEVAVIATTPVPWIIGGSTEGLTSLALGLTAVFLARIVFVNKENRALGHKQPWRETLPITLLACLIAGGMIVDGHLLYSKAIGVGVGVGWTTIATINLISKVVNPGASAPPPPDPPPTDAARLYRERPLPPPNPEHDELLRRIDEADKG